MVRSRVVILTHCYRFEEAASFEGDPALSSWNVASARFMVSMVRHCFGCRCIVSVCTCPTKHTLSNTLYKRCTQFDRSGLSQDLCTWGSLVASDIDVTSIFANSRCPIKLDPIELTLNWCLSCTG